MSGTSPMLRPAAPLLALALAACAACAGERKVPEEPGITIDATPLVSVGVEEGEAPYQLDRVFDALLAADGRIVVSNAGSGELRIFDSTGRYLASLGRRGAGPMEFAEFSSGYLYENAREILVGDEASFRVHVLAPDLSFRATRRFTLYPDTPRPFFKALAANGDWVVQAFTGGGTLSGQPGQVLESSYHLLRYDSLGAMRDSIIALPSRPRIVNEYRGAVHFPYVPLAAEPLFAVDGDRLIIVAGNAPAMEIHSLAGELLAQHVWERPRVRAAAVWDEYKRQSAVAMRGDRDSARYADFHATPLPLPEYAPLYTGIKVDPAGRIWLERFRMPLDSTRLWDVLDRDGALLGAVASPRDVTVLRFTGDKMLGRHRDSAGVERVQLFQVRAGPR